MPILEVQGSDTPNDGRLIWNANDLELEARLNAFGLNVKASPYHAVGDGVQDDRLAIQNAIDSCFETGGGYVFLPAGTYLLGSGGLLLRDHVNLIGAGMYNTTLRLGNGVNEPVLRDEVAGRQGGYAFGQIHLSRFGIDGNGENNPQGQEGIFTSAYFSVFESLYIRDCQTHGIRIGYAGMSNAASQNRLTGCRIVNCGQAGAYLDINAIDMTIAESFIYDCDYGVVICNGGVRVVNNVIFSHASAGIQVRQTSYDVVIAANDLNGTRRHAIHVTRTTTETPRPWSQILISGNSILGDQLEADNLYDAIYVETRVPNGISKLTISGNKIFTLVETLRFRYGVNFESNILDSKCVANHVQDAATARYFVGETCTNIEIDSLGSGPLENPPLPASGTVLVNPYHAPVTLYISGAGVSSVSIDGQDTHLTNGCFRLRPAQAIQLTYSETPTWVWFAD